jgi:plastocyanin
MSHPRFLSSLTLAVVVALGTAACVTSTPGWTYTPAPSAPPPPSGSTSGSAGASGSPAANGSPAASGSPAAGESAAAGAVAISASGIAFEQATVTAPAGKAFQITFDNKDAGTPHNVAIHKDNASGAEVFKGEIITGPATTTYNVPALDAGTYAFVCSVHPNMTGTLTAQ